MCSGFANGQLWKRLTSVVGGEASMISPRKPHPNVIQALWSVEDKFGKLAGIVFPLMTDLKKYEQEVCYGLLDLQLAKHVLHGLFSGVSHLHSLKILHRDLKPQNILVRGGLDAPQVKVADFGECTQLPRVDNDGHAVALTPGICTWPFRAPEVELNLEYQYPVDVWSLGLIAMELLSGRDWFHGKRPPKEKKAPLLRWIESLAGMIEPGTWKDVDKSAEWREYRKTWPCDPLATATPFTNPARPLPQDGEQLANAMLRLLPEERLSLAQALGHAFFDGMLSEVLQCPPLVLEARPAANPEGIAKLSSEGGPQEAMAPEGTPQEARPAPREARPEGGPQEAVPEGRPQGARVDGEPCKRRPEGEPQGARVEGNPPKRRRLREKSRDHIGFFQVGDTGSSDKENKPALEGSEKEQGEGGGGVAAPSASTPPPIGGAIVLKETPPKNHRCRCMGWCFARKTDCHMATWNRQDDDRGRCRSIVLPGMDVCQYCKCAKDGCVNLSRNRQAYCGLHAAETMCLELRMTSLWAVSLSELDPVDLEEFLLQAPAVNDLLLRALLADTWEPVAVKELAARLQKMPPNYTGAEVSKCFCEVISNLNCASEFTQSVMRTAGCSDSSSILFSALGLILCL